MPCIPMFKFAFLGRLDIGHLFNTGPITHIAHGLLCGTLLQHPDLARKVRRLHAFAWGVGLLNVCHEN